MPSRYQKVELVIAAVLLLLAADWMSKA